MNNRLKSTNGWTLKLTDEGPFIRRSNSGSNFESDVYAFRHVLDSAERSSKCRNALDQMANANPEAFYEEMLQAADKSHTFDEENSILVGMLDMLWSRLSGDEKIRCAKEFSSVFRNRIEA